MGDQIVPNADPRFANVVPPSGPAYAAVGPDGDRSAAKDCVEWMRTHRRPNAPAVQPVAGFDNGRATLLLPSAKVEARRVVRNGRPVREVVASAMTAPAMVRLRQRTIMALRSPDGVLQFDVALAEYAIALVLASYTADDADLTRLLDGDRWHREVCRHLLGGDAEVDRLVRLDATLAVGVLFGPPPQYDPPPPDVPPADPRPVHTPTTINLQPAVRRRWRLPWQKPQTI